MQGCNLFRASALALVATLAACASTSSSSSETKASAAFDETAMMEKWMEFATPGPAHKALDAKVGRFDFVVRMWHTPDGPMEESTGTSENKMILGNRYLQEEVHGTFQGQPFEGRALSGYDNLKKKYVGTWVDNMGTGMMVSEGTYDAAKKTFTYETESPDVMAGKYVKGRTVETVLGPDKWKMEMYGPSPEGKEFRMMEIIYTRAR